MLNSLFFLILGFILLIKGADYLVKGSVSFARMLNISDFLVGLTICSLGTSAPELFVTAISSFNGEDELALANVVGSNLVNLLLALGFSLFISEIHFSKRMLMRNFSFSILVTFVLFVLLNDELLQGLPISSVSILSIGDGIILLIFLLLFIGMLLIDKDTRSQEKIEHDSVVENTLNRTSEHGAIWKNFIYVILGCLGLFGGGKFVVDNSIALSAILGVPKEIVGLLVTSVGTSLPEIVTSLVAVKKKSMDLALGNIIGSNVFNICLVLGIGTIIGNIGLSGYINWDIGVLLVTSIIIFVILFFRKSQKITKIDGFIFVFMYIFYLVFLYFRTSVS